MNININIGILSQRGGGSVAISNAISLAGGIVGGNYSIGANGILPIVDEIDVAGTMQEDEDLTITVTLINNSSFDIDTTSLTVYKGSSQQDLAPITGSTIDGSGSLVFNYTVQATDVGKYLKFKPTITLTDGSVNEDAYSDYQAIVIAAASALDVFDRVFSIVDLDAPSDWNSNSAAIFGKRVGRASGAVQNGAAPQLVNATPDYLEGIVANSTRIQQALDRAVSPVQVSAGWEVWLDIDVTSTSGTQNYWAASGTIEFRITGGNWALGLGGTRQTFGLAASTGRQLLRISCNGATSFIQRGSGSTWGSKNTIAASPGTSLPSASALMAILSNFALNANFAAAKLYGWGIRSTAMTDPEAAAVALLHGYS